MPSSSAFRSFEEVEPNGFAQLVVAARTGMNAVPAVKRRINQIGVLRILHNLVEVNDRIKWRVRADPLIHFVADAGLRRVPSRVVLCRRAIVPGDYRDTDDLQTARLHALDNVLQSGDNLRGRRVATNIVGSHEQYDVGHTMMSKNVPF